MKMAGRRQRIVAVGQMGGSTIVINATLRGIVEEADRRKISVLGVQNGWKGLSQSEFRDMNKFTKPEMMEIARSPAAYLRTMKSDFKVTDGNAGSLVENLARQNVSVFYAIGGNSTAEVLMRLSSAARNAGIEMAFVHVPKTVDNDLLENDHTPGYGSGAKYLAESSIGIDRYNCTNGGVHIRIVMGRNAGWLTAATALARIDHGDGPHMIYVPEVNFSIEQFKHDVANAMSQWGRAHVTVSEGINTLIGDEKVLVGKIAAEKIGRGAPIDPNTGQISLSAVSQQLVEYLRNEIMGANIARETRMDVVGYATCSFPYPSLVDAREAYEVGQSAVRYSLERGDGSVTINRLYGGDIYAVEYGFVPLNAVARGTRELPPEFITSCGNDITYKFIDYAMPLVGELKFR